jgi:Na+/melibiose symporter-like transporter
MATIRGRLRQRWKMLAVVVGIWIVVMFPIPFLPLFGFPYDATSVRVLIMISGILSIPFTLLALFMNDGSNRSRTKTENGKSSKYGSLAD